MPKHVMELCNGRYCLTTVYIPKYIDRAEFYARTVHHRFWLVELRATKYKLKLSRNLDSFETKRNIDDVFNEHSV